MTKRRRTSRRSSDKPTTPVRAEIGAEQSRSWFASAAPVALIALTAAIYASVWQSSFVRFDDPTYVTENAEVKAGLTLRGLKWAMTTGHGSNWHPLTWLSHMMDVQLFGVSSGPHHVINLLLHVLNTVLLFTALRRMTRSVGRSAFVAALFAAHPLHVESVAWVSERKDVLSACFWMLTLLAYVAYAKQRDVPRYALVVVCFTLGLLAKPMVVTLPFVLLLLDVWPLRRFTRWQDAGLRNSADRTAGRLVIEKLPLFALAAVSSITTVIVQRRGGAVGSLNAYPLGLRFENAILTYVAYVGKMIWPIPLSAFYPYRQSVSVWAVAGAALLLIAATVAVVRSARQRPYLLVGWFWYLGTLVPVIGLVQVGVQSMADRYTYIPLIGLFIIVAWGTADLAERWPRYRAVVPATAVLVLAACAAVARTQTAAWRDSLTLWQHAVDVTSNNAYAQYNLGVVLVQAGRVDEGIARFRESLRINPASADVHIDLGNALNDRGAIEQALAEYATVVRLRPEYAEARVAYGNLLRTHGQTADAIAQYQTAIRLDSTLASAHNELGNALSDNGQHADALTEYTKAVRLAPNFAEAHNNVGAALAREGKAEQALGEFLEAVRLKPGSSTFHYNAALMLEGVGRTKEAIEHLRAVLQTDPQNGIARQALDRLTASRGPE